MNVVTYHENINQYPEYLWINFPTKASWEVILYKRTGSLNGFYRLVRYKTSEHKTGPGYVGPPKWIQPAKSRAVQMDKIKEMYKMYPDAEFIPLSKQQLKDEQILDAI